MSSKVLVLLCLLNHALPQASAKPTGQIQSFQSSGDSRQAVRQLFEQYKSLDLSNNPQIINLYANDAVIDVMGTRYNKTSYGRYVANCYQHPAGGLNKHTVYSEPNIAARGDTAQLTFAGALGPSTMNVYWNVRRNTSGNWQIVSEQFTAPYAASRSAAPVRSATQSSFQGSGSTTSSAWTTSPGGQGQAMMDAMKQMNSTPEMQALQQRLKNAR